MDIAQAVMVLEAFDRVDPRIVREAVAVVIQELHGRRRPPLELPPNTCRLCHGTGRIMRLGDWIRDGGGAAIRPCPVCSTDVPPDRGGAQGTEEA